MTRIPDGNPNFDAELTARRMEREGDTQPVTTTLPDGWKPEPDHGRHKRMGIKACLATCEECGLPKLRRACMEPESGHVGRNARRIRDTREKAGLPI